MSRTLSPPEILRSASILGVGIDVCNTHRFPRLLKLYGDRFLERVYHPNEIVTIRKLMNERSGKLEQFLASRWAVKEACHKALSSKHLRLLFPSIEFVSSSSPSLRYMPDAIDKLSSVGLAVDGKRDGLSAISTHVSISHDDGIAAAIVVIESQGNV